MTTLTQIELQIGTSCVSCDACAIVCPANCILSNNNQYVIETWSCVLCMACREVCPVDCIKFSEDQESSS